jgi:FkbM family methyltransferase
VPQASLEGSSPSLKQTERAVAGIADPPLVEMVSTLIGMLPRGRGVSSRLIGRLFANYLQECFITTRYGAKLAIAPSSFDLIVTAMNWDRSWEHWVYDTCQWVMPPDGVFYDIGANIGYMTVEILHHFPSATGVMFEPQAQLVRALQRSVELNGFQGRCKILDFALSDSNGSSYLSRFNNDGHASLSRHSRHNDQVKVTTMTLDQVVDQHSLLLPDVIKIDIEGHEPNALRGGLATLEKSKPSIVFECETVQLFEEVSSILQQIGNWRFFKAHGSYRPPLLFSQIGTLKNKVDVLAVESSRLEKLPPELHPFFE